MSLKCLECKKVLPEYGCIATSIDGDMVCSKECKQKYLKQMNHFITNVLSNEKKTESWLLRACVEKPM